MTTKYIQSKVRNTDLDKLKIWLEKKCFKKEIKENETIYFIKSKENDNKIIIETRDIDPNWGSGNTEEVIHHLF